MVVGQQHKSVSERSERSLLLSVSAREEKVASGMSPVRDFPTSGMSWRRHGPSRITPEGIWAILFRQPLFSTAFLGLIAPLIYPLSLRSSSELSAYLYAFFSNMFPAPPALAVPFGLMGLGHAALPLLHYSS